MPPSATSWVRTPAPPDPERPLTLGLPEGAKAPAIAALARIVAGPVLVVTARPNHALALLEDVRVWLPADDPRPVLPFPERESLPYERRAPDRDAVQARLRALASLAAGERPLIIADAQALSQRTRAIEQRRAGGETALPPLRVGGRLALEPFLTALDAAGYRVQAVVDEPGTVARRGGIIDLFPVTDETPLRIELVGDEIESLRRFDPATQRSTAQVQAATLTTATEAQVDADAVTLAASLDVDRLHPEAAVTFGRGLDPDRAGRASRQAGLLDGVPHPGRPLGPPARRNAGRLGRRGRDPPPARRPRRASGRRPSRSRDAQRDPPGTAAAPDVDG